MLMCHLSICTQMGNSCKTRAEKSSALVVVMFPNCFIQIQTQLAFGCLEMAMFISYLLCVIEAHVHILALL